MLLFFSFLIVLAVFSTKISAKFGIPVLLVFLAIGIIVGSDVLNLFYFSDAVLTKNIANIFLIFILFDGGFRITKKQLRSVFGPALILATLGVALTALVLGFFIHIITDYGFIYSMMLASIISSTDAAAVFMITKQTPIKGRLSNTLNVESAVNDPMAILLTLAFVQILTGSYGTPLHFLVDLIWQFSGGMIIGFVLSYVTRFLFNHLESGNRGYYYVLIVGIILLTYGLADSVSANGIIAVFFMGYWLGNSEFAAKRGVSNFLEGISTFGNVSLFLMLGLLAFPKEFVHIWKEGLLVILLMIFIARPIAVFISTAPFRYSRKERLFLVWGGIKGVVPIVLATYPAAYHVDSKGVVFNIIFFAVFISCLLQGSTLGWLARLWKFTVAKQPESPYTVELYTTKKSDIDMFELHLSPEASCLHKRISELPFGKDALISSIIRNDEIILPKGSTELLENDILFILTHAGRIKEITKMLN